MIWDRQGLPIDYRFLEVNPAFEAQIGLRDAVGHTIRELHPGFEQGWLDRYGRVAQTGEAARFIEGSDVLGRWFDVYAFALSDAGNRRVATLFSLRPCTPLNFRGWNQAWDVNTPTPTASGTHLHKRKNLVKGALAATFFSREQSPGTAQLFVRPRRGLFSVSRTFSKHRRIWHSTSRSSLPGQTHSSSWLLPAATDNE